MCRIPSPLQGGLLKMGLYNDSSVHFFKKGKLGAPSRMSVFSLGNITRVGVELTLLSMVLAGIKVATGVELDPKTVSHGDGAVRAVTYWLHFGERLFQYACNRAVNSKSFKRVNWKGMKDNFSQTFLQSAKRMVDDFQRTTGIDAEQRIQEL